MSDSVKLSVYVGLCPTDGFIYHHMYWKLFQFQFQWEEAPETNPYSVTWKRNITISAINNGEKTGKSNWIQVFNLSVLILLFDYAQAPHKILRLREAIWGLNKSSKAKLDRIDEHRASSGNSDLSLSNLSNLISLNNLGDLG